jgi:hypothetical protein
VTRDEPVRAEVYGEFARIQDAEKQVASLVTLQVLVDRAQARLQLAGPGPVEGEFKPVFPSEPGSGDKTAPKTDPNEPS